MPTSRHEALSDETLVIKTLLGDLDAFDELVRRFRRAVVLVAEQALGGRCGAEDVAQEAFLLAFKALPQLQDPSRFAGWLCAIARHRARRARWREGRSEPMETGKLDRLLMASAPALAAGPEAELWRKEEQSAVRDALAALPPEYRLALELRLLEEWPLARIAAFLSLPISTVKWRLHQGRLWVRRRLREEMEGSEDERRAAE